MMPEVQWTGENLIQLVEEYKKLPELWNRDHELYRVQNAKYEAWASLAERFSCDIVDLRKKFNSILASRRREKAKVREGVRSTWFLYPHLNFLSGHIDQPGYEVSVISAASEEPEEAGAAESSDHEVGEEYRQEQIMFIKQEPEVILTSAKRRRSPSPAPPARSFRPKTRRRRPPTRSPSPAETPAVAVDPQSFNVDLKMAEIINLLRKAEYAKSKDECDTFGEYIASSLRKHDEKTQSMIKQAINNILFEQEMKKYNNGVFTEVVEVENPLAAPRTPSPTNVTLN